MACKGSAVRIRLPPPGRLRLKAASLSSRGLGHRPFTAVTGVRIPLGTPKVERGAVVQSVRIPACHAGGRGFESRPLRQFWAASLSSRGLGHRPFTAVTGVRIPLGTPKVERGAVVQSVRIPACHAGGRGFESRPLRQPLSVMQRKKPPLGGSFLLRSVASTVTADRRVRKRGHCRYACCMKQRRGCTGHACKSAAAYYGYAR